MTYLGYAKAIVSYDSTSKRHLRIKINKELLTPSEELQIYLSLISLLKEYFQNKVLFDIHLNEAISPLDAL